MANKRNNFFQLKKKKKNYGKWTHIKSALIRFLFHVAERKKLVISCSSD